MPNEAEGDDVSVVYESFAVTRLGAESTFCTFMESLTQTPRQQSSSVVHGYLITLEQDQGPRIYLPRLSDLIGM